MESKTILMPPISILFTVRTHIPEGPAKEIYPHYIDARKKSLKSILEQHLIIFLLVMYAVKKNVFFSANMLNVSTKSNNIMRLNVPVAEEVSYKHQNSVGFILIV